MVKARLGVSRTESRRLCLEHGRMSCLWPGPSNSPRQRRLSLKSPESACGPSPPDGGGALNAMHLTVMAPKEVIRVQRFIGTDGALLGESTVERCRGGAPEGRDATTPLLRAPPGIYTLGRRGVLLSCRRRRPKRRPARGGAAALSRASRSHSNYDARF